MRQQYKILIRMQMEYAKLVAEDPKHERRLCGLYLDNVRQPYSLPLKLVDIDVAITHSVAQVTQTLVYENPTISFLDAFYCLPIEPNVALHLFEAQVNGSKVLGKVMQIQAARKEYEQKKKTGATVGLAEVDDKSKDVLKIKVGNIPPSQKVTLKIAYLQEAEVEVNKFWAVTLSSRLMPRYGSLLAELGAAPTYDWLVKVSVATSRPLTFSRCPTHSLQLLDKSSKCQTWVMPKSELPTKDMRFLYACEGFNQPSFIVSPDGLHGVLSLVPQFCVSSLQQAYDARKAWEIDAGNRGEFIFLIDRSGSMSGQPIKKARQALILFLKSLPTDCFFQVVSFGTRFEYMFPKSVPYSKQNLDTAILKASQMEANMQSTQLYSPVEQILKKQLIPGQPRNLLVLTDGQISDTEQLLALVRRGSAFCRCSSIGIGQGASRALVKGLAQEGNGEYAFVELEEDFRAKVIDILLKITTPVLEKVSVKFNDDLFAEITPHPAVQPYFPKDKPLSFFCRLRRPPSDEDRVGFYFFNTFLNKEQQYSLSLASILTSDAVKPLFSFRKIRALENQIKGSFYAGIHSKGYKDLRQQVVKESIESQVASQFTAWLVVYQDDGLKAMFMEQQLKIKQQNPKIRKRMPMSNKKMSSAAIPASAAGRGRGSAMASKGVARSAINYEKQRLDTRTKKSELNVKREKTGMKKKKTLSRKMDDQDQDQCEREDRLCQMEACMEIQDQEIQRERLMQCQVIRDRQRDRQNERERDRARDKEKCAVQRRSKKEDKHQQRQATLDEKIERVVALQQFDGHWEPSPELMKLLAITTDLLQKERGVHEAQVLLTYLVLKMMELACADRVQLRGILRKAKGWLKGRRLEHWDGLAPVLK